MQNASEFIEPVLRDANCPECEAFFRELVDGSLDIITVLDEHIAVDLLSMAKYGGDPACFGAYVLDRRSGGFIEFTRTAGGATRAPERWVDAGETSLEEVLRVSRGE